MSKFTTSAIVFILYLLMGGCQKEVDSVKIDFDPGAPEVIVESTVYGQVISTVGRPIPKARIHLGDKTVLSDENGFFNMGLVSSLETKGLIRVEHPNFLTRQYLYQAFPGDTFGLNAVLPRLAFSEEVDLSQNPGVWKSAQMALDLNSISFKKADHTLIEHISVKGGILTRENGENDFPLGQKEGKQVGVNRLFDFEITFSAQGSGEEVVPGRPIDGTLTIPVQHLSRAPDNIPLWKWDAALRRWLPAGTAKRTKNDYAVRLAGSGRYRLGNAYPIARVVAEVTYDDGSPAEDLVLHWSDHQNQWDQIIRLSHHGRFAIFTPENEPLRWSVLDACGAVIQGGEASSQSNIPTKLIIKENLIDPVSVRGFLRDCHGTPIRSGYILIGQENGRDRLVLTATNGSFRFKHVSCGSPFLELSSFDPMGGKSGIARRYYIEDTLDINDIWACDPTLTNSAIIITNTKKYEFDSCDVRINSIIGNNIDSSFHFTASSTLGKLDHVYLKFKNGLWISFDNGAPKNLVKILTLDAAPYVAMTSNGGRNERLRFELSNAVTEDVRAGTKARHSRAYYTAKIK